MNKLLKCLKEDEIKILKKIVLKKYETLFNENDLCKNVGFVEKGEIWIASFLENGQEVIYNTIKPGEMFGNNLIFSSEPFYRGDVYAKEESEVYLVSKEKLKMLLTQNEEFLDAYLKTQSDFGKALNLKIKLLTFNNAQDRLMFYLSINKGKIKYKSISDLAKELNLTREALSRLIHKLVRDGLIKITNKTIEKQN